MTPTARVMMPTQTTNDLFHPLTKVASPLDFDAETLQPPRSLAGGHVAAGDLAALPEGDRGRRVRRIFSAKESFHKCIHPATGIFCDFTDVSLTFAPEDGSFALRYEPGAPEGGRAPSLLRGHWTTDEGRVLTSMVWPAGNRKDGPEPARRDG